MIYFFNEYNILKNISKKIIYPWRQHVFLEFLHDGVRDGHVFEHALQFRCELTAAFSLQ